MDSTQSITIRKNFPKPVLSHSVKGSRFYFHSPNCILEVWVVTDAIIRFRYSPEPFFSKDFSYAINPLLKEEIRFCELHEKDDCFEIVTHEVKCMIRKESQKVLIQNHKGQAICEDELGYHWEPNQKFGGNYVYCSKKIQGGEYFFGLGDKSTELNLRGKKFMNWGTDTYGFSKDQDPLYRNIPFYYGLQHGIGYGIFLDNSFQTWFDFGHENYDVASFWAEGGELCYYFIAGPKLLHVAERYCSLTGLPELPPMWALGYHQSKWSYYPEAKVKEVAMNFRSRKIPCDVIHLDIDYMHGFRCFTWDKERFSNPARMIKELADEGFKIVTIIDPGIKIDPDYFVYREGIEKNYFCKRQDGDLMKGKVWPGDCHFPDFTNPEVRGWWSDLFKQHTEYGVSGIWNDMNEPAVFETGTFPDDVRHNYDGLDVSHRRAHNVYGMQMARATYEGMKKHQPKLRPFILTRSGFSGVQRFSSMWTGDNVASWEHLWIGNMQCQRLSVSGISFCGTDIGGFIGEPDGELFVRYIQMAVFHPFFRGHSSSDQGDKEPWAFGSKYETHIRKAIELRYQLLPYIYTTFWQYIHKGTPMIRPLAFVHQNDSDALFRNDEFEFGDHLLICPIGERNGGGRFLYLPKGNWFNYWDSKPVKGGVEIWMDAPLNKFPLFVKGGSVLPHYPVQNYTGEKQFDTITLHVYYNNSRSYSWMYEDEGDNYSYKDGNFAVKKFTVFGNKDELRLLQVVHSSFKSSYHHYKILIHGLPFRPKTFTVDGETIKLNHKQKDKIFGFMVPAGFKKMQVKR